MRFSYQKTPDGIYFPVIEIGVSSKTKHLRIDILIDSGATLSVFRSEIAEELGIIIEQGEEIFLGGVGGRIRGFRHLLKFDIANKELRVPVVFSDEYLVRFNLLGREGVFKNFKILFNEKNLSVELI